MLVAPQMWTRATPPLPTSAAPEKQSSHAEGCEKSLQSQDAKELQKRHLLKAAEMSSPLPQPLPEPLTHAGRHTPHGQPRAWEIS